MMMMGVSFSPQCSNAAHTYVWSYCYSYISHSQFLLHHTFYDTQLHNMVVQLTQTTNLNVVSSSI